MGVGSSEGAQLLPNKSRLRSVQLLRNKAGNLGSTFTIYCKARFRIFPPPPSIGVVRLDLGPVQDVGIPVREHSAAGIKTSKNEFWGGQRPHFFGRQASVSTARCSICHIARPPGTGTSAWRAAFSFTALTPSRPWSPTGDQDRASRATAFSAIVQLRRPRHFDSPPTQHHAYPSRSSRQSSRMRRDEPVSIR